MIIVMGSLLERRCESVGVLSAWGGGEAVWAQKFSGVDFIYLWTSSRMWHQRRTKAVDLQRTYNAQPMNYGPLTRSV